MLAFDLDPGEPATILECCRVALRLRELFGDLGLECFPKTSGSKGLQVYVPLNTEVTYEQTKPFARAVAQLLEREEPDQVVSQMAKKLRKGKVFVDWSQNDRAQDDGRRLLAAGPGAADGLDAARVGRGRAARRSDEDPDALSFEAATCSSGSRSAATCSPPVLELRAGAAGELDRR